MKTCAVVSFVIFSLLIAGSASAASTADICSATKLDIENIASDAATTVKMTYYFACQPADYEGQMNRMLVTVPYKDADNVEALDALGTMKVFEGPAYASATKTETDAAIGTFFRKALVFDEDMTKNYMITLQFETKLLVKKTEQVYTLNPKGLAANPKVTIITSGLTEAILPVGEVNYKLTLPAGSAITSSPKGCALAEGVVECNAISSADLDLIEVKWTGTGPSLWLTKVKDIAGNIPGFFTNLYSSAKGIFSK